ncbi:MAG: glycosyltransferase family 2 protein, partial [Desulfobacterales bacterium]|nr:glycosyltransferase family 2 protein [Desulfobacterales bacterium]
VDDGSRDRTIENLRPHMARNPGVIRVVRLTRNFGQTAAIQAGLVHATGHCVGIISADLQEPPEMFPDMIAAWEQGGRFIIGERWAREESFLHQWISSFYWRLIRRHAFPEFPEMGYDFCLLDRQIVNDINRINEKNSSIFVLIYWLGYSPTRIPITRAVRTQGRSQWRFGKKISFTVDTLIGFTYLPARLIALLGFSLTSLSLAYLVFALANWFWRRAAPPGWMTQVALLTLLGALISFSLGIISEYLMRILDEARKRPPYVVDEIIE